MKKVSEKTVEDLIEGIKEWNLPFPYIYKRGKKACLGFKIYKQLGLVRPIVELMTSICENVRGDDTDFRRVADLFDFSKTKLMKNGDTVVYFPKIEWNPEWDEE